MIAGGSEAAMTPLCFAGFCSMRAMVTTFNDDPSRASRPFDTDRAGFVMGEGAGVLIMETEEHALARGAPIYCEVQTKLYTRLGWPVFLARLLARWLIFFRYFQEVSPPCHPRVNM